MSDSDDRIEEFFVWLARDGWLVSTPLEMTRWSLDSEVDFVLWDVDLAGESE